ncbi:MAG: hypothetical protein K0S41_471 [Anaerocolumna sp.]|jgi:hypothetical protein|nr:hypothetical protein [Anaerocolumna sp.]
MNTFENLKKVITLGKKNKDDILTMMDVFLMNERITVDQYNELVTLLA